MLLSEIKDFDPDFVKVRIEALTSDDMKRITDMYDGDEDFLAQYMARHQIKKLTREDEANIKKALEDISGTKAIGPGLDEEKNQIVFFLNRHRTNQHVDVWGFNGPTLDMKMKQYIPKGYEIYSF